MWCFTIYSYSYLFGTCTLDKRKYFWNNHGKIMEFDSGIRLETLYIRTLNIANSSVRGYIFRVLVSFLFLNLHSFAPNSSFPVKMPKKHSFVSTKVKFDMMNNTQQFLHTHQLEGTSFLSFSWMFIHFSPNSSFPVKMLQLWWSLNW